MCPHRSYEEKALAGGLYESAAVKGLQRMLERAQVSHSVLLCRALRLGKQRVGSVLTSQSAEGQAAVAAGQAEPRCSSPPQRFSSWGILSSPRPDEIYDLCSVSWIYPRASHQLDIPSRPPMEGLQDAS
ncbi:unnamed protein product [Pleuronectes platessa]|uniref:Uncharacterized protein n=1 Tax=Pleuronectes platessa TaxID=8262 RepID=A0A9N7U3Y3_PLEPL|nr:unnamed protein product [Pleuronectes platessa]